MVLAVRDFSANARKSDAGGGRVIGPVKIATWLLADVMRFAVLLLVFAG